MSEDMLEDGLEWLREQRKAHMARTVTYKRGAQSVSVSATIGQTVFRLQTDYGIEERVTRRDYLIDAADLVLGSVVVEPQAGDTVEETVGTDVLTFEVMGPGGDEPDWRYSDAYRAVLRIHTAHTKTETA